MLLTQPTVSDILQSRFLVWYPSGKGLVCKTIIGRFDSYPHLLKNFFGSSFFLPLHIPHREIPRLDPKYSFSYYNIVIFTTCFVQNNSLESSCIPAGRRRVRKTVCILLQQDSDISGTKDRVILRRPVYSLESRCSRSIAESALIFFKG